MNVFVRYIKSSLDKIEGLAAGIDATEENTARQRAMLRLVDDIRLNLKKIEEDQITSSYPNTGESNNG